MHRYISSFICVSTFACLGAGSPLAAQTTTRPAVAEAVVETDRGREFRITVFGGGEHQLETDLDGAGEFSLTRLGAGAALRTDFNEDFSMGLQLSYGVDLYDFSGAALTVAPPASPWDDIHTFTATAIFSVKLTNDWSVFGGPVFQSARESGGDFGDSITGGGAIGVTYQVKEDLRLGGGIAIVTRLEEDVRVVPIFILDWEFADRWHIRNTSATNAINRSGIELIFDASPRWELALGAASQFSRFRLDDDAPAPDGVGEDSSLPLWFRASYRPNERCSIDGVIGVNTSGELQLEDSTGTTLTESDYDAAFFAGIFASWRF